MVFLRETIDRVIISVFNRRGDDVSRMLLCSRRPDGKTGSVQPVLLGEQFMDGCVVVAEPVQALPTRAVEGSRDGRVNGFPPPWSASRPVCLVARPEHSPAATSAAIGVHTGGLLPRRQAEEDVDQDEAVFIAGSQEEEEVTAVAVGDSVRTQQSSPGSMVCADADVEVTEDNNLSAFGTGARRACRSS
nr:unnamed protein product [Spirometra erinaceieuropaei]